MGKIITFDCYGTLMDTTTFMDAIGEIGTENGLEAGRVKAVFELCEAFAMYAEPFRRLDDLLLEALKLCDVTMGTSVMAAQSNRVQAALESIKPFPEVIPTLKELKSRGYRLVIMSNSCKDIMKHHLDAFEGLIDETVLAEDVKAYKPQLTFFEQTEKLLDLKGQEHCHVAQGYIHDMIPGAALNWKRIWVNRYNEKGLDDHQPYGEVKKLDEILPNFK